MVPFLRAVRGEKEESQSDPAERSEGVQIGDRGHLNSAVFATRVALNIGIF